jgi:hypothetical protein
MKLLHFVDAAGTDENFFPADKVNRISVIDGTSVQVFIENSGDEADHSVDLTCTAPETVALRLAEEIGNLRVNAGGVLTIKATVAPFADVSAVAFAAGA